MGEWKTSALLAFSAVILAVVILIKDDDFKPVEYRLPPPPVLSGPLAVKPIKGERLFEGELLGPESVVVEKDTLYTCTLDARCVKIVGKKVVKELRLTKHKACDGQSDTLPHCGRPLGIRRWNAEKFVIVDAMLGVFSADFESGESKQLFAAATTVLDGKPLRFADDFDFIDNDTIIVSDASTKHDYLQVNLALLEHASDGGALEMPGTTTLLIHMQGAIHTHLDVQKHPDGKSVLVSETGAARITRYYFAGANKGRREIFADNLPGIPDNIRLSASGNSMYVALPGARTAKEFSFYDRYAQRPLARKLIGEISKWLPTSLSEWALSRLGSADEYGLFVELDLDGNIVDSYHDATGRLLKFISEVSDDGEKYLYLGSFRNNYLVRILKH